jgi:hypothetical protein
VGRDGELNRLICISEKQKYFLQTGLDSEITERMTDLAVGCALVRDILPGHMNGNPIKPDQHCMIKFAVHAPYKHRQIMDTASMPGLPTKRRRAIAAASILATLVVMATALSPASAAAPRVLADALPPGHPSCHARMFDAAELAAHPDRRVAAITIERAARDLAAERKWGALEQFDGTPVVSATLRVRLRGDPVTHSARLACFEADDGVLVCETPACVGGEIHLAGGGRGAISVAIGGALKSGRFVGHYIHLDESCEGRPGGPIVLESGDDDRLFSLAAAPKQACQ